MKLDVMPIDENILGFSNRWYKAAIAHADTIMFEGLELRVVTTPHFLATKIDAFKGRGHEDYQASKDLEDIITVIDGRPSVLDEMRESDDDVRTAVASEVGTPSRQQRFPRCSPRSRSTRRDQPGQDYADHRSVEVAQRADEQATSSNAS
jgi:hypothetical protein